MSTSFTPWNSAAWRKDFDDAARSCDAAKLHELRSEVYTHTCACVQAGGYETEDGVHVTLPLTEVICGYDTRAERFVGRAMKRERKKLPDSARLRQRCGAAAEEVPTLFVAAEEAGAAEEGKGEAEEGSGVEEDVAEVVEEGESAAAEAGELGGGAAAGAGTPTAAAERAAVAEDGLGR